MAKPSVNDVFNRALADVVAGRARRIDLQISVEGAPMQCVIYRQVDHVVRAEFKQPKEQKAS